MKSVVHNRCLGASFATWHQYWLLPLLSKDQHMHKWCNTQTSTIFKCAVFSMESDLGLEIYAPHVSFMD